MLITYELDPLPFLSERRQCSSQSTWRTTLQKEKKKKKKLSFTVVTGWSLCVDCFVPVACENVDFILSFLKPAVPVVILLTERLP